MYSFFYTVADLTISAGLSLETDGGGFLRAYMVKTPFGNLSGVVSHLQEEGLWQPLKR